MSKRHTIIKSSTAQRVALSAKKPVAAPTVRAAAYHAHREDGQSRDDVIADLRAAIDEQNEMIAERLEQAAAAVEAVSMQTAAARVGGGGAPATLPGLPGNDSGERVHRAQMDAIVGYLRTGAVPAHLANALTSDDNPNGGYLIPQAMDAALGKLLRSRVTMRGLARIVGPVQGDYSRIMNVGGTDAYWGSEGGSVTDSEGPAFAKITPPVGKIVAQPKATEEVLADNTYDLEGVIVDDLVTAFSEKENVAFITGDGFGKPMGILSHPTSSSRDSARAFGTLQYIAGGHASTFVTATDALSPADCLIDMIYSLKASYRQNAVWLLNSQTARLVRRFKDMEGRHIWQPALEKGQPALLLGYPVVIDEEMPDVGADAFPIAFGDFKRGYVIVDKPGAALLRDPFTLKGYLKFYCQRRVGGAVEDSNAIKLLKIAAS